MGTTILGGRCNIFFSKSQISVYWMEEKKIKREKERDRENNPGKRTWNDDPSFLLNHNIHKYKNVASFSIAWPCIVSFSLSFCFFVQLWIAHFFSSPTYKINFTLIKYWTLRWSGICANKEGLSQWEISATRNGPKEAIHSRQMTDTFIKLSEDYKSNWEPKEITVCWIYKYM